MSTAFLFILLLSSLVVQAAPDSLSPATADKLPKNPVEVWTGYDPTAEPLEVKVVREWDVTSNGHPVKLQLLTFKVGTFKGKDSRIAAYYAYPTDSKGRIPGLVQVHGGGQSASKEAVLGDAGLGYASISINWGGRDLADQKPGELGTDWGLVDPTQKHVSHYFVLTPDDKTTESIYHPRNNNWFLLALATRRALTFLEQQPVVDPNRLGVYGHSMGGKITTMAAGVDPRIKASVPSCGGSGVTPPEILKRSGSAREERSRDKLFLETIEEMATVDLIKKPILYMGPHNDFHGLVDDLCANWKRIPDPSQVFFSITPHFNHRNGPSSENARIAFFDAILKEEGTFPSTPKLGVELKTADGVPLATVRPDAVDSVESVQVFYSINPNARTRFWRSAETTRDGEAWKARLPLLDTSLPLFVMANVEYKGSGKTSPILVSSWIETFEPAALKSAGVQATDKTSRIIQANFDNWNDWFRLGWDNPAHRSAGTRKLTDPKWRGPDGAALAIDVLDPDGGSLNMTFEVNKWQPYADVPQGSYSASAPLAKSTDWQTVTFQLSDLKPKDAKTPATINSWQGITDLGIAASVPGQQGHWADKRKLRNLRWVGGNYTSPVLFPGGTLSREAMEQLFQENIDESLQVEANE